MSQQIYSQRHWYNICSVQFSFCTAKQIRNSSVCEITSPQVYDSVSKQPLKNGLYDGRLGVTPNERFKYCQTCGQIGLQCSGHSGHIELIVPVYNSLTINHLIKLLRNICLQCNKFRIKQKLKDKYRIILNLLKQDKISQAKNILQINIENEKKQLLKLQKTKLKQNQKQLIQLEQQIIQYKNNIKQTENIFNYYDSITRNNKKFQCTNNSLQLLIEIQKMFYNLVQNKCPYCNKPCHRIKKQGSNKIFLLQSRNYNKLHNVQQTPIKKQRYLNPYEIYIILQKLWQNQFPLMNVLFGNSIEHNDNSMFFFKVINVCPSRFRPESKLMDEQYLHDHTSILNKILTCNLELKKYLIKKSLQTQLIIHSTNQQNQLFTLSHLMKSKNYQMKKQKWYHLALKLLKQDKEFINKWLELQDNVNILIDSDKSMNQTERKGVKQLLQRKQGLFRMKMMGKRVNYAARSVISPDPTLESHEIGVPIFMAKKLTFPQRINQYNLNELQQYIVNGKQYPGANLLEENGKIIKLDLISKEQRQSYSRNLWNNHQNKIIYRHLLNNDFVLFNRQPTLHKPGLMAHKVKVLQPNQSTLRINYANCKSYNADFDGDEMNMHVLQNYMSKSQTNLCRSDRCFISATNGKPIRQCIQDSIIAAVFITMRNSFFNRADFSLLLYAAIEGMMMNKEDIGKNNRIILMLPAIIKPKELWTGKQLFSNVIKMVVQNSKLSYKNCKGLSMRSESKINRKYLQGCQEQVNIIIKDNELIQGIIDKNQLGANASYGLMHSFYEIYGFQTTGNLLTCLNKLFLHYIQMYGFTCGLDDLILSKKADRTRNQMIQHAHQQTIQEICKSYQCEQIPIHHNFSGRSRYKLDTQGQQIMEQKQEKLVDNSINKILQQKIVNDHNSLELLDSQYKHHLFTHSSNIVNSSLGNFMKKFPKNNFSMMTITGAKGSNVNHSQIAVMLGQQQLEGRRVPMMISGKTLPSFAAYDPNPRSSGYISDRFLTGLRPQQFYFHCMAGRQGLIDTAVKTSRSGYLQRCLMKHLQSLKVEYDCTVRDSDGSIVQFLYGQDALNPAEAAYFNKIEFLNENRQIFLEKYKYKQFSNLVATTQIHQWKQQQRQSNNKKDTIMNKFNPNQYIGSISQQSYAKLQQCQADIQLKKLYALKYKYHMVEAGESVGCLAAQSIGEPSTQMTLNTFHLAGSGGVNVTLGVPRLRELLMTSTNKIKTPIMQLYFKNAINSIEAEVMAKKMKKVSLSELIKTIQVEQYKLLYSKQNNLLNHENRCRCYRIKIICYPLQLIKLQFNLTMKQIHEKIKLIFVPKLLNYIDRVKKHHQLHTEIKRVHQKVEEQQSDEQQFKVQQQLIQESEQLEIDLFKQQLSYFQNLEFNQSGTCTLEIKVSLEMKKFLIGNIVEKLLKSIIIREIPGIQTVSVLQKSPQQLCIQTNGVNFSILHKFAQLDENRVRTNDVQAMSRTYGIQAARYSFVQQIIELFAAYGITVDHRHLYLIGDYLTFDGVLKAMNRNWMTYNTSPFLRMSFETSVKFLTDAALHCEMDLCKTPSSSIVLGQVPKLGTGICELLMDTTKIL